MKKKFILALLGYSLITFALGVSWHFLFFKDLYHSLGIYNKVEPNIALGFSSMIIQGLILAYLYPRYYRQGSPLKQGVKFGLLMGIYMFSVSTMANAAKIEVSSLSTWMVIQALFHGIQFVLAGAAIGLAYGKLNLKSD